MRITEDFVEPMETEIDGEIIKYKLIVEILDDGHMTAKVSWRGINQSLGTSQPAYREFVDALKFEAEILFRELYKKDVAERKS